MPNANVSTLAGFLERVFPSDIVADDIYTKCTAVAIANKTDFDGDRYVVKVKYVGQQGRSASYANAVNNRTSSKGAEFLHTDYSDYSTGGIENKAILTLANNKNAFKKAVDKEMDSCKAAMARSFASAFWGEQNGSIGRILSLTGGGTIITLTNKGDVKFFHEGQVLNASSNPAAGAPDRVATGLVSKTDRIAGTVTLAAAPAAWAANDWLYVQGDYRAKPNGIFQLIPETVTPGENFLGVDRSLARFELAGAWFTEGVGGNTDEVISAAMAWAADLGAEFDTLLINPIRFNALAEHLKSKSAFAMGQVNSPDRPAIGFKSITFVNPNGGTVEILADQFCPRDRGLLFKRSDLTIPYRGKAQGYAMPDYVDFDGMKVRRARATEDASEWELFAHYTIAVENPRNFVVIRF
jgi:hypothetical protein